MNVVNRCKIFPVNQICPAQLGPDCSPDRFLVRKGIWGVISIDDSVLIEREIPTYIEIPILADAL